MIGPRHTGQPPYATAHNSDFNYAKRPRSLLLIEQGSGG
jgi:hypothetical protein